MYAILYFEQAPMWAKITSYIVHGGTTVLELFFFPPEEYLFRICRFLVSPALS